MLDLDLNPKEENPKLVNMCKKEGVSFAAMAAIELVNVGLSTLYKAAALKGLSYFVFIAYSYAIGALVLFPLIFIFPRLSLCRLIILPPKYRNNLIRLYLVLYSLWLFFLFFIFIIADQDFLL